MVGDGMIRGVSGGQKRRVTLGEMIMPPRSIKYMDAISNGLDAATTHDLTQAMKLITKRVGLTTVVSLLQVSFIQIDAISVLSLIQISTVVLSPTAVASRVLHVRGLDLDVRGRNYLPRRHYGSGCVL